MISMVSFTRYFVFSSNNPCSIPAAIEKIFNEEPGSYWALILSKSMFKLSWRYALFSAAINISPVLAFAKTIEQFNASVLSSASEHKFSLINCSSESRVKIKSFPWVGWTVSIGACGIIFPFGDASYLTSPSIPLSDESK